MSPLSRPGFAAVVRGAVAIVALLVAGLLLIANAPDWMESTDVQPPRDSAIVSGRDRISSPGPVVILGASYAEGWKPAAFAGVPVINRGVAGQQSFEMLARFDRDVVAEKPRAVILWGFINDIFRAPADVEPSLAKIRDGYTEMIARARQHGIVPILATEVTMGPRTATLTERVMNVIGDLRGKESYQDRINVRVMEINRWLVDLAAREQLNVLQFQSVLSEPGGRRRRPFAQPDGSHITQAGYDALTTYASPILEQVLIER